MSNVADLTEIMATSRDWDELLWAWQGWRNESAREMPPMYEEFVGLLNQAATMNGEQVHGESATFRGETNCW